jgi:sugar lactone lactonase YvrE
MIRRPIALAAITILSALCIARAEPAVVASGAYPEGLLWHGGRMYFTEMGADQVSIIENGSTRAFWHGPGCGPTSIAPYGPSGFLINCHLGKEVVEVSATGVTGRHFREAPNGIRIDDPNASVSDGEGGVYFSDSGTFHPLAPSTGRVYHLSASGVMTEVVNQIHYANGVAFDRASRTLYVSEHLSRRILALTVDSRQRVTARKVFTDFAAFPSSRDHVYPMAGPDGIILRKSYLIAAEYGEARVHVFGLDGKLLRTLKVDMPFVDTVELDAGGSLYAGGSFQNDRPPFEGAVVRFAPNDWEPAP